ncbi:MAG: acyltransferase, partial [Ramlibacter sp.]|nr:acyltransferase [Ramlibacter sp.]
AVHLFFVISGFIITKLLLAERSRTGSIDLRSFYRRRILRILPPLIAMLAVTWLLEQGGILGPSDTHLQAALFLCNTTFGPCVGQFGHLWSLAVEEQFYMVWPFVLLLFGPRAPLVAFVVLCVLTQTAWFYVAWVHNEIAFACVGVGALVAARPGLARAFPLWLVALCACLFIARPLIPLVFPLQYRIHSLLMPLFAGVAAFGLRHAFRDSKWLAGVGLWSYSIYLWQQMFLVPRPLYPVDSPLPLWPLLFVVAFLSYRWIELPFQRMGRAPRVALASKSIA